MCLFARVCASRVSVTLQKKELSKAEEMAGLGNWKKGQKGQKKKGPKLTVSQLAENLFVSFDSWVSMFVYMHAPVAVVFRALRTSQSQG